MPKKDKTDPKPANPASETLYIEPITPQPEVISIPSVFSVEPIVMQFDKLVFRDGINVTVRKGTRWDKYRGVLAAEGPDLLTGEPANIVLIVHDTMVMSFKDVASPVIMGFNHDEWCQSYYRLFEQMKVWYAPVTPTTQGGFSMDDEVTVIFFTVRDSDGGS